MEPFIGLWRREALILPDGSEDRTTQVFWLQGQSWFVDIRLPADRPAGIGRQGFADYTDAELIELGRMQGFAGIFEVEGALCRWHRHLDFQPPGGMPDEGNCTWLGPDRLLETGIHADYQEIWQREPAPGAETAAFRLAGDTSGLLVLVGDVFALALDRDLPMVDAPSLAELVEADLAAHDRIRAVRRLGMCIAMGRIEGAALRWCVTHATFPWLEGTALFPAGTVPSAAGFEASCLGRVCYWQKISG
jgi:hypothetical protein